MIKTKPTEQAFLFIFDPSRKVAIYFDGATYDPALDGERLETQLGKVYSLMRDGKWRTLGEIQAVAGGSEAGISARLRDFRKPERGSHCVERRRRGDGKRGLFEYRVNQET